VRRFFAADKKTRDWINAMIFTRVGDLWHDRTKIPVPACGRMDVEAHRRNDKIGYSEGESFLL